MKKALQLTKLQGWNVKVQRSNPDRCPLFLIESD